MRSVNGISEEHFLLYNHLSRATENCVDEIEKKLDFIEQQPEFDILGFFHSWERLNYPESLLGSNRIRIDCFDKNLFQNDESTGPDFEK